jgi:L-ribulose-5-phosphate 3-epimerase
MAIGIMQGRLVPPVNGRLQCFPKDQWREEFPRAAEAGLAAIEWIFDAFGADVNPIKSDEGVAEMMALSKRHQIEVLSICADYFMDFPLLRVGGQELAERIATLMWLIRRAAKLAVRRIVLPFVDASQIRTLEEASQVPAILRQLIPVAESAAIELHLETALDPEAFAKLLNLVEHPLVRVNYDSGNSASLGYDPVNEFAAYGARVGSVHIKDRVRGGGSTRLGTGDVDFPALARSLRQCNYAGDFILQTARGEPGDEVTWARKNRFFVESQVLAGM